VREVRNSVCGALGSGELGLAECLAMADDPAAAEIQLGVLLDSLPRVRKVDARRALAARGIEGRRAIGRLDDDTVTQVLELAAELSGQVS